MVAPSKRNCRIAQRIARAPRRARGAHTRSSCSRNVTVWQVCSRHIHRRIVPPEPCRDPGPGRVDHLHHHTPVALSNHPTTRAASTAITGLYVEHQSIWGASHAHQMEALQTDEQITPITTTKRHRAVAGRVRHCRGPLKTAGVEVRSSSRTSTSTRNPRPTPGHPHSTRKSRFLELHTPFPADQRQTQPNCHTKSNSRLDTFSEFEISRRVCVAPALPGIHYLNLWQFNRQLNRWPCFRRSNVVASETTVTRE